LVVELVNAVVAVFKKLLLGHFAPKPPLEVLPIVFVNKVLIAVS